MRTIFLYGIGGTSDCYRVIQYIRIDQQDFSILTLRYEARMMKMRCPNVERVFAIDNRPGLARSCAESIKNKSIESRITFADLLEREAVRII